MATKTKIKIEAWETRDGETKERVPGADGQVIIEQAVERGEYTGSSFLPGGRRVHWRQVQEKDA